MTCTYLIKRKGIHHFRIRVPKDLRTTVGSGEIHRSLGTSDSRLAKTLAGNLKAKVESEFAQIRHQHLLTLETVLPILPHDEGQSPFSRMRLSTATTSDGHQTSSPGLAELIEEFVEDRHESWALKTRQMQLDALHPGKPVPPDGGRASAANGGRGSTGSGNSG